MPSKDSSVKQKQEPMPTGSTTEQDSSAYEEERIPFHQVLRKLVNTKPAHKVAQGPARHNRNKSPKKA